MFILEEEKKKKKLFLLDDVKFSFHSSWIC